MEAASFGTLMGLDGVASHQEGASPSYGVQSGHAQGTLIVAC
jgi:hypothetical protein